MPPVVARVENVVYYVSSRRAKAERYECENAREHVPRVGIFVRNYQRDENEKVFSPLVHSHEPRRARYRQASRFPDDFDFF